jgi:hypothetical protein
MAIAAAKRAIILDLDQAKAAGATTRNATVRTTTKRTNI